MQPNERRTDSSDHVLTNGRICNEVARRLSLGLRKSFRQAVVGRAGLHLGSSSAVLGLQFDERVDGAGNAQGFQLNTMN